ncbi:protein FAR1-RELATED SEQUENCE 3-like [Silene latifolia]|uniref:protein FAR1-RELATED SEQUENCE 3-like n=1 Tax=Silene latifolia TaxID=37657 RepID=UPI003D78132C
MIFAPFTGVDHHKKSVTFGASLMSRENDQNFKWIFTKILDCMSGKEPHCFFTDQCPAMKIAVLAFTTRCPSLLHVAYYEEITRKEQRNALRAQTASLSVLRILMAHLLSFGCAFKVLWIKQRYTQKSLDRDSDHSLPQTKTLLSLELHASIVYTHALFYEFQQSRCVDSLNSCSAGDSSREGKIRFLEVEDSIFNKSYTIAFNPSTFDATCSCKLFERKGYICKHIIWILSGKGIKKIPDKYVLSRWTKNTKKMPLYDAHGQLLDDFTSSDVTKLDFDLCLSRILLNINTAQISA